MNKLELEKYLKNVFGCERCGVCVYKYNWWSTHRVCPAGEQSAGFEPYFPRGKIAVARGILEGALEYNEKLADVLTWCTTCMNCAVQCGCVDQKTGEYKINTPEIVEAMRTDLVNCGLAPAAYVVISTRIKENKNPYGEPKEERMKWAKK